MASPPVAHHLQQQQQQWASSPMRSLLQPLLLYGALHAATEEAFVPSCGDVLVNTMELLTPQPAPEGGHRLGALSPTVQCELLLLALQLVKHLQQLRGAASNTSSSSSSTALPSGTKTSCAANWEQLPIAECAGVVVLANLSIHKSWSWLPRP
jgi:hypothetical protein